MRNAVAEQFKALQEVISTDAIKAVRCLAGSKTGCSRVRSTPGVVHFPSPTAACLTPCPSRS